MKSEKWLGVPLYGDSKEVFSGIARDFKSDLVKNVLPYTNYELYKFSKGYFYFSAILKNKKTGSFVHVFVPDVRFFVNEWYNNIVFRSMENENDYTGGRNHTASLPELAGRLIYYNL